MKVLVLFSSGLAAIAAGVLAALLLVAPAAGSNSVTLCHLADGPAKAGLISVAPAAAYNGHYLQHSADIIPPFDWQGTTYSLNWDPAVGFGANELCGETPPPTTTDEEPPPVTTTDEDPPVIPPVDPPVTGIDCPVGEASWKGKCYPVDGQKQPDGSVVYGEQG